MKTSWGCVIGGHRWRQLPGEPGGVSRLCGRCGVEQRVDWVYMGPGTGLGLVRSVPTLTDSLAGR
jgi:hypothetical protein